MTKCDHRPDLNVYSIEMGRSELVLHDDGGTSESSIVSDFMDRGADGLVNPDYAAINIENSTDVIIGTVTQFKGPVTIYQSVNGPQQIEQNNRKSVDGDGDGDGSVDNGCKYPVARPDL